MAYSAKQRTELKATIANRLPTEPLTEILDADGMPDYSTVMRWLYEDEGFRETYTRARLDQGEYEADRVAVLGRKVERGDLTSDAGRVAIDAAKWSAGVRAPVKYGTRTTVAGDPNAPLIGMTEAQIDAALAARGIKL